MAYLSNRTDENNKKTYLRFIFKYLIYQISYNWKQLFHFYFTFILFIYSMYFTTGILKGPVALESTMVEDDSDSPIMALTAVFPEQMCCAANS